MSYPQVPVDYAGVQEAFGDFSWKECPSGHGDIIVDPQWRSANITGVTLHDHPSYVWAHRLLKDVIYDAYDAATAACPGYTIDSVASFCSRHKLHDVDKPLSLHSWGIAVDINSHRNAYGTKGDMPPAFVAAWKKFGWHWGGDWRHPDPMHFQWAGGSI